MANITMVLKRSPYGDINAAEAVRHALGAVSSELSVDLILVDGGVLLAKKGQDDSGIGFTNLESSLRDCIDMGVSVYASSRSLEANRLKTDQLIDGVKIVNDSAVARLIKDAKVTMIF